MNSVSDIWTMVLEKLKNSLSETTVSSWFDETSAVALKEKTLYLFCPSEFKRGMIENLYMDPIRTVLKDIFSADFSVRLLSEAERAEFELDKKKPTSLFESGEFTFDTFVVGPSNQLACSAAKAVANAPAEHYNPLYIYGDSGLGKTHLLYAIAHEIRKKNPAARIVYIKGDDLTIELVDAIKVGPSKTAEMREKYRKADLFLVDDVHTLAGRKQTQEEFFNTFNTLYESKKQIVLTSDRRPREMESFDERLITRFEWGLPVDIQPPEFETRLAIVKNKAAQWGTAIDEKTATRIAETATSNIRQIEGMMNKILAYRDLLGQTMNEEQLAQALEDFIDKSINAVPTAESIINVVVSYFNTDRDTVVGTSQSKEDVLPRQIAMYLIHKITKISTNKIGSIFSRDHATVLYSIKKTKEKESKDAEFAQLIREIEMNINCD